jgi:hypothetical protein
VQLSFEQGKLAFLQLFEGRATGAVFSGRGHIVAAPRDVVEKQQMAHFLGAPLLDQDFTSACLRFTDDTASDLLRQLRAAQVSPQPDSAFAARWDALLATLNPGQSLRFAFANSKAILFRCDRRRHHRAFRHCFGPPAS